MTVRGAPAIAIVAVLSLAVELEIRQIETFSNTQSAINFIIEKLKYLEGSRPTAVNLFEASAKLQHLIRRSFNDHSTVDDVIKGYTNAAKQMLIDDVNDNKAIGDYGAKWLIKQNPSLPKFKVLTHCNTGSLATAGYGTALGVIRSLSAAGVLEHAYCTETRPYNQGSRLTAYELVFENIPSTLITDSMASALFKKENGLIRAVIVGADRVARNGDTANKVCGMNLLSLILDRNISTGYLCPISQNTFPGSGSNDVS
jgi:methylthioribose-1-phosphate isomerase